jgi:type VI secretion system secreted protein Hcp
MPNPIYAWFKGVKQGDISGYGSWVGEDDQVGREGSSFIQSFEHKVEVPRDKTTGIGSGRRIHGPVILTKRIDKASPLLYSALRNNEGLTVTIKWYRFVQGGGGGQEHYYTTLLEDARLAWVREWFPMILDLDTANYGHQEQLALAYRRITWTWVNGGVEFTDDWIEEA